jgi:hypothetical protein
MKRKRRPKEPNTEIELPAHRFELMRLRYREAHGVEAPTDESLMENR